MVSPRTALLLLLATSASARMSIPTLSNLHRRSYKDLTDEQLEKIGNITMGYEAPKCIEKCGGLNVDGSAYIPRCALSDQTAEEDVDAVVNSYSCICADRQYVEQSLSCLIKECGKSSSDLEYVLSSQYGMCMLYADIVYPEPDVFLNELCLLDDVSKDNVPTEVPLLREIFPDYTFAKDWPEQTATTWIPTATPGNDEVDPLDYFDQYDQPKWTCTPTPLSDDSDEDSETQDSEEKQEDDKVEINNTTSNGNLTTKGDDDNGASGRQGMMGMAAVVAAVAGLAVFL